MAIGTITRQLAVVYMSGRAVGKVKLRKLIKPLLPFTARFGVLLLIPPFRKSHCSYPVYWASWPHCFLHISLPDGDSRLIHCNAIIIIRRSSPVKTGYL
ncbi:hypothetical protein KCP76_10625 [Salmonella enterica subsp. enterica serovar Weltevreden]|nr:hypothetical protein KCP76_10625 [Salmonella enterica subsp. enterica serovar Weltevreden]